MAPVWRCTVDGCQTASLPRPQAAQLDLIAGHRVRSAAGTLLRSHESLNHLLVQRVERMTSLRLARIHCDDLVLEVRRS
jgi:hypothetical protein